MSGNINNLLFWGVLFWGCKKSCPGLSWLTPGDLRHCHNTQNIGCNCQKRNSGHKHIGILEKFSSDFKPVLAIPKKSPNPWCPSDAELKEEFGSNLFLGGRNLSVFLASFLVSPHLNGDVTEPSDVQGNPKQGNPILQGPVDEDGIPSSPSPSPGSSLHGREPGLALGLCTKSALYWGEWAGIDSSAGFSASRHARLGEQSQVKLQGSAPLGWLQLLLHAQSVGVSVRDQLRPPN